MKTRDGLHVLVSVTYILVSTVALPCTSLESCLIYLCGLGLFKGDFLNQIKVKSIILVQIWTKSKVKSNISGLKFYVLPNQRFYQISWFKFEPNQSSSQMLGLTFIPNQSLNHIGCEIMLCSIIGSNIHTLTNN